MCAAFLVWAKRVKRLGRIDEWTDRKGGGGGRETDFEGEKFAGDGFRRFCLVFSSFLLV